MKLQGLKYTGRKVTVLNGDQVDHYSTHALGGGEWSIEAHRESDDYWVPAIKEWVGSNGTREEADDLWKLVDEWAKQVAYSYKEWQAPDGETGSMTYFMREAEAGHLHGCLLVL